jgi:hypothetical protein
MAAVDRVLKTKTRPLKKRELGAILGQCAQTWVTDSLGVKSDRCEAGELEVEAI